MASAIVAPKTTRSSLAHSALAMHIGHGSQVEYIVYPASDGRFSFLQARRTVRVSACELGSFSRRTALVARISRSPVRVFTIRAPNGAGYGVSNVRAVKRTSSRIRCSSEAFRFVDLGWRRATSDCSMAADLGNSAVRLLSVSLHQTPGDHVVQRLFFFGAARHDAINQEIESADRRDIGDSTTGEEASTCSAKA